MLGPKTITVGEISTVVTKGTTPTSLGQRFTSEGVRFLKVETFTPDGKYISGREAFIDPQTHTLLRRSQLKAGDILFSIAGALGRTTVVEQHWLPANTNQALSIIRLDKNGPVNPGFLLWYLRSDSIKSKISEISVQAAQANLSLKQIRDFEIRLIPLPQQDQIVTRLDAIQELLDRLEKLIAKKQAIKQGMMQQLLTGKTRLPGFSSTWRAHQIGTICSVDPESISPASVAASEYIDYIAIEDVSRGALLGSSRFKFGEAPSRARRALKLDDVLFGTVRPNLQSHARYRGGLARPVASTGFTVLRSSQNLTDPSFLFHWVLSDLVTDQIEKIIAGSSYPAVSSRDVRQLNIYLPPVDEQKNIGRILDDVDAEIKALGSRLALTKDIKQGMMQELLTGRTRLIRAGESE